MKPTLLYYPRCSASRKAMEWLNENHVEYAPRHIVEENPTADELRKWITQSGLPTKKFFNTGSSDFKELRLRDTLPEISPEQQVSLLGINGKLVKRPILVCDDYVFVGFNEKVWEKLK